MTETLYSIFSSLPFCICLCWWLILLLRRDAVSSPAHRYLSLLAFVNMVLYLCHTFFFNGEEIPAFRVLYYMCLLAVFPLFWIYIRALTEPEQLKLRAGWVLAPTFLAGIVLTVVLACGGTLEAADLPIRIVFMVELVLVCVSVLRRLTVYDRKVQNFYADTERKSPRELRSLFYLMIPVAIFSGVTSALGREFFANRQLLITPSLLSSALLFGIFHVGFLMEYTATEMAAGGTESPAPEKDDDDDRTQRALLERIRDLIESQRLYLTPGLKVTDVAEALDTNRTYVSACINRQAGMSFSDYVNGFRVRHAQELLLQKDVALTLTQIGVQSGFSGDTSFFRNFKKVTGQTPSEWLSLQKDRD